MPRSGKAATLKKTILSAKIPESVEFCSWHLDCQKDDRGDPSGALWALGMISSYTAGGVIHLLLVIAVIVVVFQFIGGRRSVWPGGRLTCTIDRSGRMG